MLSGRKAQCLCGLGGSVGKLPFPVNASVNVLEGETGLMGLTLSSTDGAPTGNLSKSSGLYLTLPLPLNVFPLSFAGFLSFAGSLSFAGTLSFARSFSFTGSLSFAGSLSSVLIFKDASYSFLKINLPSTLTQSGLVNL